MAVKGTGGKLNFGFKFELNYELLATKKTLTKETLGDFEPYTLVYESTDHQWEKKLKNRISNGSVSPLAVMDRMLKVCALFTKPRIIINIFDGSTRRELFKHLN